MPIRKIEVVVALRIACPDGRSELVDEVEAAVEETFMSTDMAAELGGHLSSDCKVKSVNWLIREVG